MAITLKNKTCFFDDFHSLVSYVIHRIHLSHSDLLVRLHIVLADNVILICTTTFKLQVSRTFYPEKCRADLCLFFGTHG